MAAKIKIKSHLQQKQEAKSHIQVMTVGQSIHLFLPMTESLQPLVKADGRLGLSHRCRRQPLHNQLLSMVNNNFHGPMDGWTDQQRDITSYGDRV